MSGADIIAIIILAAIVIAVVVYLLHWLYRHSSKDLSFVRTGFGGEKIVMGGGALVLPIVHDITEVSMNTLRIEVRRTGEKSLITKNMMRIEVVVEFFVRVIPTAEAVAAAARTLGNRTLNPESLRELVQGRFVDAMSSVAAAMTMEQIHENRSEYVKGVRGEVAAVLTKNGLELEAVSFTSLDQADIKMFNPSNAFDAEGLTRLTEEIESRKKKRNDIEQDTMIAIRQKNLESEKLALSIDQESEYSRLAQDREVSIRRAQQKAEIARQRSDSEREIEEVHIQAKETVEKARIQQERAIEAAAIMGELETQKLEIHRRRTLEMENQNRLIAVAVNEAEGQTMLTHEVETRKKKRNEIEQDTLIAMSKKTLEAEKAKVSVDKDIEMWRIEEERAVAVSRAQQRAGIALQRTESDRQIEEADIHSKETIERARIKKEQAVVTEQIQQEGAIEAENILRNLETQKLEIHRRRALEMENQDRLVAVAVNESEGQTKLTAQVETDRKMRNEIEKDTLIAISQKTLEAEKVKASIEKDIDLWRLEEERAVAVSRAQQRAGIALERTETERQIEEAHINSKETIERAHIKKELAVVTDQIKREQETERLEVLRRRAIELEEQERMIAVSQGAKVEAETRTITAGYRALLVKAEELVVTAKETEIAERRKSIDIIDATQQAQREAIQLTTHAAAERDAAKDLAQADQTTAEAAQFRYAVDAEGRSRLNEAENLRSDKSRLSALHTQLIESLPAIIRESVKPMESIESIKILQVDGLPGMSNPQHVGVGGTSGDSGPTQGLNDGPRGGGSLADNVVSSALRYRAQAPFVDNLLSEIGMSANAMSNLSGLESLAKLEHLQTVDEKATKDTSKRKS